MRGKRTRGSDDVWNGHGGYMGMKKAKLIEQFKEQAQGEEKQAGIFSGVSIFVNGWTKPSSDELKRIMMSHGGVYHHYHSHKTTHIIASNLPDVKVRQMKGNELIVKPEWITACLQAEHLVDYKPYLLVTNQSRNQPTLNFKPRPAETTSEDLKMPHGPSGSFTDSSPKDAKDSESPFKAKDAKDPRFLGEFFQNSRLHHISTMGSNAKAYVSSLRERHNGEFPARSKLQHLVDTAASQQPGLTIMHIDMDCFFVSVGLRDRPHLIGRPVAVTHAKGNRPSRGEEADRAVGAARRQELFTYQQRQNARTGVSESPANLAAKLEGIDGRSSFSEVASCSYEARAAGVKNGMFLGPALKLCPNLQTIPYDFPGYEEVSRLLYDTVASYTLDIQAVSCDEMFVDLTPLLRSLLIPALAFVSHLRAEIQAATGGCRCSVGLGANIFLARMATKKAKPDGQYQLHEQDVTGVLADLSVTELPGVGRSLQRKLAALNIINCSDLQGLSLARLQAEVGNKVGKQLYNFCRGVDERKLELEQVRKTVGAEVNYGIRFKDAEQAAQFVDQLSTEVAGRLNKLDTRGRCITLKLMLRAENAPEETAKFLGHGVCDNISRSVQLDTPTSCKETIFKETISLLRQTEAVPADIRGVGISVSKLEEKKVVKAGSSILKFVRQKPDKEQHNEDKLKQEDMSLGTEKNPSQANSSTGREPNSASFEANSTPREINSTPLEADNDQELSTSVADLDPEVLAALPEDIRLEVLAQYKISRQDVAKNTAPPPVSPQPGPSRYRQDEPTASKDKVEDPVVSGAATSMADLSFSQIDNSVLSELPPELRDEITNHFQRQAVEKEPLEGKASAFSALMRNSPRKATNTKVSPVKGKKRGRPKKNSVISPKKGFKTTSATSKKTETSIAREKDRPCSVVDDNNSLSNEAFQTINEQQSIDQEKTEPTFCGKSRVEDIRPLIKEWLASTDHPLDEDICMMSEYLEGLVVYRKIHIVSILIKCIQRNISKLSRPGEWKASFASLVNKVQQRMLECYGNPLAVSSL